MKSFLTQFSLAAALLGIVTPAYSASLSFSPAGSQLDSDSINDLEVSVGQPLTFTLSIDTTGLTSNLKSFTYLITRDNREMLLTEASITPEADVLFEREAISDVPSGSLTIGTVRYTTKSGQTFAPDSQLDFAIAIYNIEAGLVNDGLADYDLELIQAIDEQDTDILEQFTIQKQTLDLQPTSVEPTSVPEGSSTLGFFALSILGATSIFKHKLKR